jgi:hypothetical protein
VSEAARVEATFNDVYGNVRLQVPWYAALGDHDYLGDVAGALRAAALPRGRIRSPRALSRPDTCARARRAAFRS